MYDYQAEYIGKKYKKLRDLYASIRALKQEIKGYLIDDIKTREYRIICYRKLQELRIEFSKELERLFDDGEFDWKDLN